MSELLWSCVTLALLASEEINEPRGGVMSRSGYADDCEPESLEEQRRYNMYRGRVASAIRGKRGQDFLKEVAAAMDAMPEKVLIANELINEDGDCCTIGVVCKARGLDVSKIDYEDPEQVAAAVGIAKPMAAEIEWENDDYRSEHPAERWKRMRKWVADNIKAK